MLVCFFARRTSRTSPSRPMSTAVPERSPPATSLGMRTAKLFPHFCTFVVMYIHCIYFLPAVNISGDDTEKQGRNLKVPRSHLCVKPQGETLEFSHSVPRTSNSAICLFFLVAGSSL